MYDLKSVNHISVLEKSVEFDGCGVDDSVGGQANILGSVSQQCIHPDLIFKYFKQNKDIKNI